MQKALAELESLNLIYTERTNGKYVTKDEKLTSASKLSPKDEVSVTFHDGVVKAKVLSVEERGENDG